MAGNMPRVKGAIGERDVARLFVAAMELVEDKLKLAPDDTRRCSLRVKRSSGMAANNGGDDLVGIPLISVEVKRSETLDLKNWSEQTQRQAREAGGLMPVLIYRQSRKPWRVQTYATLRGIVDLWKKHNLQAWIENWVWVDLALDDWLRWYACLYEAWLKEGK